MRRPAKFGRNRSSRAEDTKDTKVRRVRNGKETCREGQRIGTKGRFDYQRQGTLYRSIWCNNCQNRSTGSKDIQDFSKSKMAAEPPFWI